MTARRYPNRADIQRIVGEEAQAANVSAEQIIGVSRDGRVVRARHHAIRRILCETGCSQMGLADVWGCSDATVRNALANKSKPDRGGYDVETRSRLTWRYGEARTAQIVAGRDPKTRWDIARWRALGLGRGAAA